MTTLVERYARDGYYFPVRVTSAERAVAMRTELERAEARPDYAHVRDYPNIVMPWLDELIRDEAILAPVRELLGGEDVLVWGANFFIKEAHTESYVSWHQDLHYWGLNDLDEVTAWVALSPATVASGCMRFIPGTHRTEDIEHRDTFAAQNLLSRGQELAVEVDDTTAVDVVLEPGEMSLHHGRLFHASHPNCTGDRRIGIAIRYIPPHMRQANGTRTLATLVSGEDRYGHFELTPRPSDWMSPEAVALVRHGSALKKSILFESAAQAGAQRA